MKRFFASLALLLTLTMLGVPTAHSNELLSKLSPVSQMQGAHGAENSRLRDLHLQNSKGTHCAHENSSTGVTQRLATGVEFPKKLTAYFFHGDGCLHCAQEHKYLKTLKAKYPTLTVSKFEIFYNEANNQLLQRAAQTVGAEAGGVPFLVIGDKYFIGYADGITQMEIEEQIKVCLHGSCTDLMAQIIQNETATVQLPSAATTRPHAEAVAKAEENKTINLPLWGELHLNKFSLPTLSIVLGILDGFNPCAMWVLLFLISLLLGMRNRRRMWILGTTFIAASAAVYFVFMAAWLNLFLFLGFILWIRIGIGILALGAGIYSVREFWTNKDGACTVGDGQQRQKILQKLKDIVRANSFWLALFGIIVLAALVNLIELICSAGLPAIYTQVLAMNVLPRWQYYAYILLYILFFMLDDLVVFCSAMVTLELTGLTTKYTRYSRLVGGCLMLLIGALLILKPQLLMFN